ncbi:hypothetical protein [Streptomyces sp. NPDC005969]|uniref:hypothetical protein n=1 Tax=Streptomyces sp. NPDC005969 TaxID=3156722 RepID=UPI0033E1CF15
MSSFRQPGAAPHSVPRPTTLSAGPSELSVLDVLCACVSLTADWMTGGARSMTGAGLYTKTENRDKTLGDHKI